MPAVSLTYTLQGGTPENINQVQQNFVDLRTGINGNLDGDNVTAATRQALGLSDSSNVRRGHAIIAAQETTSSVSFTSLTTPDTVSNVLVPSNGLIAIMYEAQWVGDGNSQAAIFLNAVQVQAPDPSIGGMTAQSVSHPGGGTPKYQTLYTGSHALSTTAFSADAGGIVATGQSLYALVSLHRVTAGTYSVGVKFRNIGGTAVVVRSRELYVEARSY